MVSELSGRGKVGSPGGYEGSGGPLKVETSVREKRVPLWAQVSWR